MIQSYSQNITVLTNSDISFNNTFVKGKTVKQIGSSTFQFNKKGLYLVTFNGFGSTAGTAGNIAVQMVKDGVLVPEAQTVNTSSGTTDIETLTFTTKVQVPHDNSECCNVSPTVVSFRNVGVEAVFTLANVVITKVC